MATIGVDCDIKLTHPDVNGGEPVGFVLRRARKTVSGLVTLRRQAYRDPEGYYVDRLVFWMTVHVADELLNPNGSRHARTRAQIYASLLEFLAARSGITLECQAGIWTDLHATLTVTTEYLGRLTDEVVLRLNSGNYYDLIPIDRERFLASEWDGVLTWDTSYWR
jgi:hypothetical protein